MKLIIDIDDNEYTEIKMSAEIFRSKDMIVPHLYKVIESGIPLPKGHGDLVDRDRLINRCLFMSNDDTAIEGMEYITKGMIKTAPTVIEADKEK